MREIKFRAWSKVFNRFAPDHAEYHFNGENSHLHFDVFNGNFDTDVWDFSECEITQYTGLKDKNGVEIYEGDIVNGWTHNPSEPHVVKYISDKYNCGFMASSVSGHGKIHVWYDGLKIIGNIYENPELLEQSK